MKAVTLSDSAVRKDVSKSIKKMRSPETFADIGPMAKLAKLREASVRKFKIERFFKTASHMHALTGPAAVARDFRHPFVDTLSFVSLWGIRLSPCVNRLCPNVALYLTPGDLPELCQLPQKSLFLHGSSSEMGYARSNKHSQRAEISWGS